MAEHDQQGKQRGEPQIIVARPRKARLPVYLNVYTILPNGAEMKLPLGLGLYHSGVEVGGVEYGFGGGLPMPFTGVWTQLPRIPPPDTVFKDHIFMGETPIVGRSLEMLIKRFMHDYPSASYHLTKRNCNHFSAELVRALTGRRIPGWVNRAALLGRIVLPCIPCCLMSKQFREESMNPEEAEPLVAVATGPPSLQGFEVVSNPLCRTPADPASPFSTRPGRVVFMPSELLPSDSDRNNPFRASASGATGSSSVVFATKPATGGKGTSAHVGSDTEWDGPSAVRAKGAVAAPGDDSRRMPVPTIPFTARRSRAPSAPERLADAMPTGDTNMKTPPLQSVPVQSATQHVQRQPLLARSDDLFFSFVVGDAAATSFLSSSAPSLPPPPLPPPTRPSPPPQQPPQPPPTHPSPPLPPPPPLPPRLVSPSSTLTSLSVAPAVSSLSHTPASSSPATVAPPLLACNRPPLAPTLSSPGLFEAACAAASVGHSSVAPTDGAHPFAQPTASAAPAATDASSVFPPKDSSEYQLQHGAAASDIDCVDPVMSNPIPQMLAASQPPLLCRTASSRSPPRLDSPVPTAPMVPPQPLPSSKSGIHPRQQPHSTRLAASGVLPSSPGTPGAGAMPFHHRTLTVPASTNARGPDIS